MFENEKNHVASEWEELIVAMVTNWGGHYHQLTSVDTSRVCSRWLASDVDDDDNERRQGQRCHWLSPAPAVCKWRFSAQLYADECRPRPAGRCSRARHQGAPSARQPTSLSSSFNSSRWIDRRSRDPIPSPSLRICPPPSLPAAPGGRENGRQVRRSCMETPRCCWWRKVRACWMMKMMMQASVARRFSLSACVSLYAFILSLYARPPLQLLPIIYVGKTTCSATINYSPLAFHVTF